MRPYIDMENDDAVNMIRHDDEGIQCDSRPNVRRTEPSVANDAPVFGQSHTHMSACVNVPQQTFPLIGADRDEIRSRLCIIVVAQTDGATRMPVRIVGHYPFDTAMQGNVTTEIEARSSEGVRCTPLHRNSDSNHPSPVGAHSRAPVPNHCPEGAPSPQPQQRLTGRD